MCSLKGALRKEHSIIPPGQGSWTKWLEIFGSDINVSSPIAVSELVKDQRYNPLMKKEKFSLCIGEFDIRHGTSNFERFATSSVGLCFNFETSS
jgi:hypothetical protein